MENVQSLDRRGVRPNVRLSFDGFKVWQKVNSWRIDGFAMRPDLDKPGFFDNTPTTRSAFGDICDQALSRKFLSKA